MGETEHIAVADTSEGQGATNPPGEEIQLPVVELLTGRGFVTGKSGSGKSNSASVIAERLLDNGFGLLIIDVDGEYYGLKEEYEILHVGADEECDIQVTTDHAEKLASLALEQNVPIILDVSSFLDESEAEQLLTAVARSLFAKAKKQKQPFLMLVEEVHEYIPEQGSVGECGRMLIKIGKRGRKHGLGICGISQRPADVKKDFITQCDWLLWHRLTWKNDTQVVKRILDSEYAEAVEDLDDGEGFLATDWSGGVRRVQFHRKETFDAGATPGLDDFERPDLKSVSDDLVSELAEISDEATAREDRIGELRSQIDDKNARIAELERELQDARDLRDLAEQFVSALTVHGEAAGRTERELMREQPAPGSANAVSESTVSTDTTSKSDATTAVDPTATDGEWPGGWRDTDSQDTADTPSDATGTVDPSRDESDTDTETPEPPWEGQDSAPDDHIAAMVDAVASGAGETPTDEHAAHTPDDSETPVAVAAGADSASSETEPADDPTVDLEQSTDKTEQPPDFSADRILSKLNAAPDKRLGSTGKRSAVTLNLPSESGDQSGTESNEAHGDLPPNPADDPSPPPDDRASDGGTMTARAPMSPTPGGSEPTAGDGDEEPPSADDPAQDSTTHEQPITDPADETVSPDDDRADPAQHPDSDGAGTPASPDPAAAKEPPAGENPDTPADVVMPDKEPAIVEELIEAIEDMGTVTQRMLEFYAENGPASAQNAHFAAGGDGDRTRAYAKNRTLRTGGFIEHVGRGQYDYRLRKTLAEALEQAEEAVIETYASKIENTVFGE